MTELNDWARELLRILPEDPEAESVELSAAVLSNVPASLECRELVIKRGFHDYDTWRVDYPQWSADKPTYAALGLAILASLFHRSPLTLKLTNPHSEIRTLVVQRPPPREWTTGLELSALSLRYDVARVARHPWVSSDIPPDELPWFKLTNLEDDVMTEQQRAERNTIHGFGSLHATARFARLLLDLSRRANETLEVALECEAGFRGVAPASVEVRLWLPGSIYWNDPAESETAG